MRVQIIEKDGKPEWAIVPYATYQRLLEQAEVLEDIRAYDGAKHALKTGDEELIPSSVVYALLDGENPIRVWRRFRQMTQAELAAATGISTGYLSQLETDKRNGTPEVLARVAQALDVTLDELVEIDE